MNFLQLVQRFRQETNYANTGPTTVTSQSGDHGRAVDWVATAYTALQQRHQWRWLRKGFTLTTSSGTDTYDHTSCIDTPTGAAISRFKSWSVSDPYNPPRIYLSSAGSGTETWLSYISWESFRTIYKIGSQENSYPAFITIDPDDNLVLGPKPNDTYVITGEYHRSAQILSANTDEPEMPADYHMLIVYMAMLEYGEFDAAPDIINRAARHIRRMTRNLEATQMARIRLAGPMA